MKKESKRGFTNAVYILLVLIFLMLLTFLYDGYCNHLLDMARTYDHEEVTEAITAASVLAVSNVPMETVFYYDSTSKQAYTRSQVQKENIVIKGYGRTREWGNRNMETGARGIPNTGNNPDLFSRLFHTGTSDGRAVLELHFKEDGTFEEAVWTML